jgi:hypothetical protein
MAAMVTRRAYLLVTIAALLATPTAGAQTVFQQGRIPHRDGSGHATILEVAPGVPNAKEFLRADDRPPPGPGEISVPTATPVQSPSAVPSPSRVRSPSAGTARSRPE